MLINIMKLLIALLLTTGINSQNDDDFYPDGFQPAPVGGWDSIENEEKVGKAGHIECKPGYKLSKIARDEGEDGWGGPISVECEEIDGVQNPVCEIRDPLKCNEESEECRGVNEYVGGMQVFLIDSDTGAYQFQPICCQADNVVLNMKSCKPLRINAYKAPFDFIVSEKQVFKNFLCYLMKDRNQRVHDAILKPKVCDFKMKRNRHKTLKVPLGVDVTDTEEFRPNREVVAPKEEKKEVCSDCQCNCGPYTCPDGTHLGQRIAHKRRKRTTCACVCECNFVCLPDDDPLITGS